MNFIVAYLLFSPPHIPIRKYIGISKASKNINNEIKSPLINTPLIAKCNINSDPTNPLLSEWSLPIESNETNTSRELNNNKSVDIPERPKCRFIP